MENENEDDKPTFYGLCPISGTGKQHDEWARCIGDDCAWFESANGVCALTCIALYTS